MRFSRAIRRPTAACLTRQTFDDPDHFVEIAPFEAQDAQPISYGESVEGTITSEQVQQVYSFEGHAGDVITVRLDAQESLNYDASIMYAQVWSEGRDLEPYVVLLSPSGEYLVESRDFLYETFAQVQSVTLPEDGTYTIVATRYMGRFGISAGDYTLTVTK